MALYGHFMLEVLGVKLLSRNLTKDPIPEGSHFQSDVPYFIAKVIPLLQRFFYSKRAGDYHEIRDRVTPQLATFK